MFACFFILNSKSTRTYTKHLRTEMSSNKKKLNPPFNGVFLRSKKKSYDDYAVPAIAAVRALLCLDEDLIQLKRINFVSLALSKLPSHLHSHLQVPLSSLVEKIRHDQQKIDSGKAEDVYSDQQIANISLKDIIDSASKRLPLSTPDSEFVREGIVHVSTQQWNNLFSDIHCMSVNSCTFHFYADLEATFSAATIVCRAV